MRRNASNIDPSLRTSSISISETLARDQRLNRLLVLAIEADGNKFCKLSLVDELLGRIAKPHRFRPVYPQDGPVETAAVYLQDASSYGSAGRRRLFRLLHRSSIACATACREGHAAPSEATVNNSLQQQSKFPAWYCISVSL